MKKILACILALSFCITTAEAGAKLQKLKNIATKVKTKVKSAATKAKSLLKKKTAKTAPMVQAEQTASAAQEQVQNQQTINKEIVALIDDILSKEISNCPKEEFNKCKEHPWLLSNNGDVKYFCGAETLTDSCSELLKFAEFIKEAEENMGREFSNIMKEDENLVELANTMVTAANPSDEFFKGVNSFINELEKKEFKVDELKEAFEKFKKIAYCFEKGENDAEVRKMFDEWKKDK